MIFGKRGLSAMTCMGLIGGLLVGGSSVAHAAVGDKTVYDVEQGGATSDLKDIVVGPDGLLWLFETNDDVFVKVNASGEVVGIVNADDCGEEYFKISYADSLWCFADTSQATRYYANGQRTTVTLPQPLQDSVVKSRSAAIGPDGQLWVSGVVNSATIDVATNDDQAFVYGDSIVVTKIATAVAAPMSTSGIFGSTITLGSAQGDFVAQDMNTEHPRRNAAVTAGPGGVMYYAWSPGFDVFTGEVTNVYGTFTTDGAVTSSREVGSPRTIGMLSGRALTNGGQVYLLGQKYITEEADTVDANGNPVALIATATNERIYRASDIQDSRLTLSEFTAPTTLSRQDLDVEGQPIFSPGSQFAVDQQGYFWIAAKNDEVARVSTTGNVSPRVDMPAQEEAEAVVIGSDGNAWVAADRLLVRVLTGAVPTNAAAPTLSQVDGVTVGAPISGTSGEWNDPSGTYEYQWQVCSSSDAATCTDIPGATSAEYTPTAADDGKYVRMASYATSVNGRSEPAYSGLVAVGAPVAPPAANPGAAVKATGSTAVIGNAQTMELDVPRKTKRGKKKLYEVFFTATDVPGTVTFTFKRRSKVKTVTVPIEDGIAEYRWKTPRKWPRGKTRVTATYVPSAGSPYTAAAVTDRVRVRGR